MLNRPDLTTRSDWERVADTPEVNEEFSPQGITAVDGKLLFTNHWDGAKSVLYRLDQSTGEVEASAPMPSEAKHTSGLAWDGDNLWAVDHDSNLLYKIDLEATFDRGEVIVEEEWPTGLRGTSGLTLIEEDGREYLAVSDFLWTIETTPSLPVGTGRTFIAPLDRIDTEGSVRAAAEVSYSNGGYSQGLTWDGTYLYESVNILGTNRIDVLDVSTALSQGNGSEPERLVSFEAPGYFVEDLATDGTSMWTTDEHSYGLYRFDKLNQIRRHV